MLFALSVISGLICLLHPTDVLWFHIKLYIRQFHFKSRVFFFLWSSIRCDTKKPCVVPIAHGNTSSSQRCYIVVRISMISLLKEMKWFAITFQKPKKRDDFLLSAFNVKPIFWVEKINSKDSKSNWKQCGNKKTQFEIKLILLFYFYLFWKKNTFKSHHSIFSLAKTQMNKKTVFPTSFE